MIKVLAALLMVLSISAFGKVNYADCRLSKGNIEGKVFDYSTNEKVDIHTEPNFIKKIAIELGRNLNTRFNREITVTMRGRYGKFGFVSYQDDMGILLICRWANRKNINPEFFEDWTWQPVNIMLGY